MAFEIREKDGIFELLGNLTAQHVAELRNHVQNLLEITDFIGINLENTKAIDQEVSDTLADLFSEAIGQNKIFALYGRNNPVISGHFKALGRSYMLSSDRV